MRARAQPWLVTLLVALAACAHGSPVGELRFKNQPPVWRVNDRAPLARPPAEREYNRTLYHVDGFVVRRLTRVLDMRGRMRAADVNALDEVPDSTWFTNRIGVRDMSIDELRRGPNREPGPFAKRPWKIKKSKAGGTALGFQFEDSSGDTYLLKFDPPHKPEMETAAHAIVHRILWACGYNVPEDYIGYITRDDLVLSTKASKKDSFGNKIRMTEDDLDRELARAWRDEQGRYRVLASRFLPGTPIGPYAREGTRPDDPNDRIPHERRRSLRGQYAFFAWLNHTDLQEDNTLDMFEDGHVIHYLIDFGNALGVMGWGLRWQTVGYTYRLDLGKALSSLVSFGLWERPWEDITGPGLRGIGLLEADHYDPGTWRPNSFYWPYEDKDRFDAFWAAKILMRFSRDQLAAIVDEARLSDPRASAYMLETLIARQRKTARHWFEQVAPLDQFRIDSGRLCFTDLLLAYDLASPPTRYELVTFDREGTQLTAPVTFAAGGKDAGCAGRIQPSSSADGYTIARIRVARGGDVMPEVRVHLARDPAGQLAIIGLRRE